MSKVKLIQNGGSLAESDLLLLRGDPILMQMMRNRRMMHVDQGFNPNWESLTQDFKGLYHIRKHDPHNIFQIWFELVNDLEQFEKNLYVQKLST